MNVKLSPVNKPEWPNLVLCLGAASLVLVCLFLLAVPGYSHLKGRAQLAGVRGNAATVQLAAETYAAAHLGSYPVDPLDLIPYLPGDRAPGNPLTGGSCLFRGGVGDLTYRSPSNGSDYVIQAFGPAVEGRAQLLLTLKGKRSSDTRYSND